MILNEDELRQLVERQARAWENADLDAITADFAEDGVLISPGGRWQGAAAIRAAAESFFTAARDVQVQVTAEWTWSETRLATGQRHSAEDAIIFTLRDGKIVYWREYFDTAQMG